MAISLYAEASPEITLRARWARRRWLVLVLAGLAAIVLVGATTIGSVPIPASTVAKVLVHQIGVPLSPSWDATTTAIVLLIRLPRILLAAIVGAGLAEAGAILQGLFRNPLADPYVIGTSAGAGLGATLAIVLNLNVGLFGLSAIPLLAFLGAVLATLLVYRLAHWGLAPSVESLLLAGVATSSFLAAGISILLLFSGQSLGEALLWLMGGFSGRGWEHVRMALPYTIAAQVIALGRARDLNALAFGEDQAQRLGVDVRRARRELVAASCLMAAAAAATSGLIGFVGLIVPHMTRLLIGPDHRWLLPASALAGAVTLVVADGLARSLLSPSEVPVGVITAFFGAPLFLYLLRRRRRGAG